MTIKIKYVAQRYKKDCLIACLAMILPTSYESIIDNFCRDFDRTGLEIEYAANYLMGCGFFTITKVAEGAPNQIIHNAEMWKSFAPIHIVSVQQYVDKSWTHAIIMDNKGKIYDPGNRKSTKKDFYEVIKVVGLFPYSVPKGRN